MTTKTAASIGDVSQLLRGFDLSLRAANKAPTTVSLYVGAARQFHGFLEAAGMPTEVAKIRREHVEAFIVHISETRAAATANNRYRSLASFFKWAREEGEIAESPMVHMKPPKVPEVPVPVVAEDDLRKLLKALDGKTYDDRRDTAIVRLFLDSGMRLSELANLTLADLDHDQHVALVVGKGRRPRACPFGIKTAQALDRYLRVRRGHPKATTTEFLWLGPKGRMTDSGVRQMLERRAQGAGIGHVHPHQLRHTFAHQWLADGGRRTTSYVSPGGDSRPDLSSCYHVSPIVAPKRRAVAWRPEIECET